MVLQNCHEKVFWTKFAVRPIDTGNSDSQAPTPKIVNESL